MRYDADNLTCTEELIGFGAALSTAYTPYMDLLLLSLRYIFER